jgi:hypothetical protein
MGRAALEKIEAEAIRFAITHYGGRMSEVARRLRTGRSTLYRELDSLGRDISDPKTRGNPATPPGKRLQRRLRAGDAAPKLTKFARNKLLEARIQAGFRIWMAQLDPNAGPRSVTRGLRNWENV